MCEEFYFILFATTFPLGRHGQVPAICLAKKQNLKKKNTHTRLHWFGWIGLVDDVMINLNRLMHENWIQFCVWKANIYIHIFQKFHTAYRNDIRYSKIQVDSDHNILQKLELHAHRRMRCGCFGCGRKWVSFLGYQRAPSIPMRLNQTLKIHSR